jgi:hypothetical protein
MTSIRRRSRDHVRTFLLAGTLVLAAGCATPPESRGQPRPDEAVPAPECAQLQDEIARTEQARRAAAEQSGNAWKASFPSWCWLRRRAERQPFTRPTGSSPL